ncbi:hypothetical protein BDM02DRAFT_3267535 [Thelephora ganbajun]|uniref:Uncharacterized protein n=1 Tax=Thelephora ganbajun TaxID=370292 RepID=A0ACB6ZPE6_THEGA|nr:hypothetical protein BDM02DRAFT_3267535 [Thelephora ganbajun]
MTLPANDAFTLGLAHDDTRRRPHQSRSRSLPRSPSPKISFSSSKPTIAATHTSRVERGLARRASKHISSNQHKDGSGAVGDVLHNSFTKVVQPPLQEIEEKREDSPTPSPATPIQKVDWEIPRKILHSSIGFLTLYLYYSNGSPRPVVVSLGTALVAVIAPADAIRLRSPRFERFYERCLGFLMRESEKKSTNGVIWYILGVVFVLVFLPLDIAVVSILILSWADTNASTFGRLWGRKTRTLPRNFLGLPFAPRKSLAGFVAASLTGALTAVAFWGWFAPLVNRPEVSWTWIDGFSASSTAGDHLKQGRGSLSFGGWMGLGIIGIFAGLASGVAEALDLGSIDDNLSLPVISGTCLCGLFKLFGYMSS